MICKLLFSFQKIHTVIHVQSFTVAVALSWWSQAPRGSSYLLWDRLIPSKSRANLSCLLASWKDPWPKASFHSSTGIGYILHSFLQSPPRCIHFQIPGMPCKEKLCFPFPQNSLSTPLLKASAWAGWNGTKPAIQTQGLRWLLTTLPYWVTSPGSLVSALCSLHAENASLERRGHWGVNVWGMQDRD